MCEEAREKGSKEGLKGNRAFAICSSKNHGRHEAIVPARPRFSALRVAHLRTNQTRACTSTYPDLETMSTRVEV